MSVKEFKLTKKQEIAKAEIEGYINGTKHQDKDFITISGSAGSGKTTVLNDALKAFKTRRIYGAAISNSACNVLEKSIPFAKVQTITKLLKEQLITDKHTGEQRFETITPYIESIPIFKAEIVPIDECSMISQKKIDNILEFKKPDTKIIFLGDIAQLSVIENSEISPAFKNTVIELDEIMRSKEPLDEINGFIRKNILSLIHKGTLLNPEVLTAKLNFGDKRIKDSGYYTIKDENTFIKKYIEEYHKSEQDPMANKIIAYTNRSISSYNNRIRKELYGDINEKYVEGDKLITNKPYMDNDIYIPTNTYVTVKSVNEEEFKGVRVHYLTLETVNMKYYDIPVLDFNNGDYQSYIIGLKRLEMKAKKRQIKWDDVNDYKNSFCNVSFSYAINSHKSQGQGFSNVFVCESEIKGTKLPSNLNKLQSLYVATSRAEKNVYLF